jgi:hypothetical protein
LALLIDFDGVIAVPLFARVGNVSTIPRLTQKQLRMLCCNLRKSATMGMGLDDLQENILLARFLGLAAGHRDNICPAYLNNILE